MYWKCWSLAFDHLKAPAPQSHFVSDYLDEGFSPQIFQWDTIFMMMFARYAHREFPSIHSLDNFYVRQHPDGFICREIREADGEDLYWQGIQNAVNPPLFSWAEVEYSRVTGETSRFGKVIGILKKYAQWLESGRKKTGTAHGLYWNTGLGSGMDNSPRHGSGWVDMSSQMVMMYRNLAIMSRVVGNQPEGAEFDRRANDISAKIQRFMWSERDGFYYDVDDAGTQVPVKTIAGFWPMIAGIARRDQAERLVAHLKDAREFWRDVPFPSLPVDHPLYKSNGGYWVGGVWAPTNVMIIKGLERYGFEDFASFATLQYLDGMQKVFRRTGTVWENYAPDAATPGEPAMPDFVGWSGCGPIQLLLEDVIGIRANGLADTLVWHLQRIDRHGVEQLRFGAVLTDLVCERRESIGVLPDLHIMSSAPYTLRLVLPRGEKILHIAAGSNDFSLETSGAKQ
jgi:glycogen debranching enzyme